MVKDEQIEAITTELTERYKEVFSKYAVQLSGSGMSIMTEALFLYAAVDIAHESYSKGFNDGITELTDAIELGYKTAGL